MHSTYILALLPLALAGNIAKRHAPLLGRQSSSGCDAGESTCGIYCIDSSDECCPDLLGGCPAGSYCSLGDNDIYGCCDDGETCTGDGGTDFSIDNDFGGGDSSSGSGSGSSDDFGLDSDDFLSDSGSDFSLPADLSSIYASATSQLGEYGYTGTGLPDFSIPSLGDAPLPTGPRSGDDGDSGGAVGGIGPDGLPSTDGGVTNTHVTLAGLSLAAGFVGMLLL